MSRYEELLGNIKESINEVVEEKINQKVNNVLKDKHTMSEKLYEVMFDLYLTKSFKKRKNEFIKKDCRHCRFNEDCDKEIIPKNIGEPIKSEYDFIPGTVCCEEFEWD